MKRHVYRGFVIDTDNLGRQYIYDPKSGYSEDSGKQIVGVGYTYKFLKSCVDIYLDWGYTSLYAAIYEARISDWHNRKVLK